jgi:hypothetical protein
VEKTTCEHRLEQGGICGDCEAALQHDRIDFSMALQLMKHGVPMARLVWMNGARIECYQDRIRYSIDDESYYWKPLDTDLLADDWALVGCREDV